MLSASTIILLLSCIFAGYVLYEILPPRGVKQIDVIELREMMENKKAHHRYIDVRPVEQFNAMHVYGFENIPLRQLKKKAKALSKDEKLIVICERGNDSNEACRVLKRQGFTDLVKVRGGIITWEYYR